MENDTSNEVAGWWKAVQVEELQPSYRGQPFLQLTHSPKNPPTRPASPPVCSSPVYQLSYLPTLTHFWIADLSQPLFDQSLCCKLWSRANKTFSLHHLHWDIFVKTIEMLD